MNLPSSAGKQAWRRAIGSVYIMYATLSTQTRHMFHGLCSSCKSTEEDWTFLFSQCKRGQKNEHRYLLMLSTVTRATVRTGAALHGHWCMGRSFMLPGVWSIDSLTSALREAADGLETWARVPAVTHTCYQSGKKEKKGVTCRTSLNESHQGHLEKAGGVGSDTRDVVGTADSKCGYMRLTACSTPFPLHKT